MPGTKVILRMSNHHNSINLQVGDIASNQSVRTGLATRITCGAGSRAHELLTLRRKSEQPASTHRKWSNKRFSGRIGEAYTVVGKGGLVREIRLPGHLARALEDVRLAEPQNCRRQEYQVSAALRPHRWCVFFLHFWQNQ